MEIVIVIIVLFIIGIVLLGKKTDDGPKASTFADPKIFVHFETTDSLFVNEAERAFFYSLRRAALPDHYILIKPRLEDVIRVRKELMNNKLRWQLRGRIKSRHVDYVIMDGFGRPLCGVELDGKSHGRKSAEPGDALKDGIFAASGLPLFRVIVGENFEAAAQEISRKIAEKS